MKQRDAYQKWLAFVSFWTLIFLPLYPMRYVDIDSLLFFLFFLFQSSLSSSSQVKASITSSSGLVAPVTTAPLSFSLSSLSSGSLVQNQVSPSNIGIALNSGGNASLPGSDVSSLATSSSEDKSAEVGMVQSTEPMK